MAHKIRWPRRRFLQTGAGTFAAAAVPHVRRFGATRPTIRRAGQPLPTPTRALVGDDPAITELARRAVEAAKAAGASYADARLTYRRARTFWWAESGFHSGIASGITESELCHIGVRALVNGYWGFATHPYWVPEAATWLGRTAVQLAKVNGGGSAGPVELAPAPRVVDGHWVASADADPFALPAEEVWDRFGGILKHCNAYLMPQASQGPSGWVTEGKLNCWQEQQVFVSSEGSNYTQTRTRATPFLQVGHNDAARHLSAESSPAPFLVETAGGVAAALDEARIFAWLPEAIEEVKTLERLPWRPVQVGRYDMVWDAPSVGNFLGGSLGQATQIDRILGYEANATGTSYLGIDPLAVVGTQVAAPLVTVTADRTRAGGLATVGWDAEGVAPEAYPLVTKGVLSDLQATRAEAAVLAPYYQKSGLALRARGGGDAEGASTVPLTHTPNLVLSPGAEAKKGLDQLVSGLTNGLLLRRGMFTMDFQGATGFGQGTVCQVKNGKLTARVSSAGILTRSTEVLTRIRELGGADSVEAVPLRSTKGQPAQTIACTAWTVPALVADVTIIDQNRRGA